jgi:hypothetical protein
MLLLVLQKVLKMLIDLSALTAERSRSLAPGCDPLRLIDLHITTPKNHQIRRLIFPQLKAHLKTLEIDRTYIWVSLYRAKRAHVMCCMHPQVRSEFSELIDAHVLVPSPPAEATEKNMAGGDTH